MKNATIPFPRQFGPGVDPYVDVRAVKRALAAALGSQAGMSLKTNTFAKPAQDALVRFKKSAGLLDDPIYTSQAHDALTPDFDEYGASLMVKATRHFAAVAQRAAFLSMLKEMLVRRVPAHYKEVRPIPYNQPPLTGGLVTDCSGSVECAAKWSGLPDPSGLAYADGAGNTGTLLAHGAHITVAQALPADLIVYRKAAWDTFGHHVVAILSRLSASDFDVFSHGHEGDPQQTTHSAMAASQARSGYGTATFLRWLPAP